MAEVLLHDCVPHGHRHRTADPAGGAGTDAGSHGYNKFFGPGGLKGTAGWVDSMGMKPGMFHARVAATAEMAAGIGLAVGLLTPMTAPRTRSVYRTRRQLHHR